MNKDLIKLVEMTMTILEKKNWDDFNIEELTKKMKKKNIKNIVSTKDDLLNHISRFFDYKMIKQIKQIEQTNKKDMIFEIMMTRFDILQIYRKQIIKIFNFLKAKPHKFIFLLPSFIESMIEIAKIAKIPINGIKANIKIKGLLILYFATFLTWLKDPTKTLEKTMNALDDNLDKAGKILDIIR